MESKYNHILVEVRDSESEDVDENAGYINLSKKRWVRTLDPLAITHMSETLDQRISQSLMENLQSRGVEDHIKVKMAFGRPHYQLINAKSNHVYSYQQLSSMVVGEHFKSAWSSVCTDQSDMVRNLVNKLLLEAAQLDEERVRVLKVHLVNPHKNTSYTIKFHRRDQGDEWVPKDYYAHRNLYALVDCRLDDATWLRTRFYARSRDDPEAKRIAKTLRIAGDFNHTRVTLDSSDIAKGYQVEQVQVKFKRHIDYYQMRFSLYYAQGG